jgi:hypothetical protein
MYSDMPRGASVLRHANKKRKRKDEIEKELMRDASVADEAMNEVDLGNGDGEMRSAKQFFAQPKEREKEHDLNGIQMRSEKKESLTLIDFCFFRYFGNIRQWATVKSGLGIVDEQGLRFLLSASFHDGFKCEPQL